MYNFFMQNFKKFKVISGCLTLVAFAAFGLAKPRTDNLQVKQQVKAASDPIDYGTEIDEELLATTFDSAYKTETSIAASVTFEASEDYSYSYYCGYGTSAADFQPATLEYKVNLQSGGTETRTIDLHKNNQNAYYDFVGAISEPSLTLLTDIPINPGETLVDNSYRVFNIFASTRNSENKLVPQTNPDGTYVKYYSVTKKADIFKEFSFSDFASIKYQGCSTFNGYSTINFTTTSYGADLVDTYRRISSAIRRTYDEAEGDVQAGKSWIRTMLAFNNDSKFIAYYDDGSSKVFDTKSDRIDITNSGTGVVLLYNDFKTEGLVDFEFYNFYIYVDLYSTVTGKSVPKSNAVLRFAYKKVGVSEVKDAEGNIVIGKTENPYFVNVDLAITLTALAILLVYVGGALGLFFYRKKKFADDEFKRVRPKEFFQTAIMGLFAVESIVLAIESIVFRSTVLATSFDVYNTIDVLIIVFSIASIILGGYFIKYFATAIKNIKAKRDILRLQLNQDRMDDGVLLMPNSKK